MLRMVLVMMGSAWAAAVCDAGNLVPGALMNVGFRQPEGWSFNESGSNRVAWVRSAGKAPEYAVRLSGTGQDWAGASSARASLSAAGAVVVQVSAWVWTEGATSQRDRLYIRFFRRGEFAGQEGPTVDGEPGRWRRVAGSVPLDPSADAWDLSLQVWSPATVWMTQPVVTVDGAAAAADAPAVAAPDWTIVEGWQGLPPDADRDGVADALESWMGGQVEPGKRGDPCTSFQTGQGYIAQHDLATDIVIVAAEGVAPIQSWAGRGYEVHAMAGFRAGTAYVEENPGEVQTDRDGQPLVIAGSSFYMVPTEQRRMIFRERFERAVRNGAQAVCPEEPEYFARAGYSGAFRAEWERHYGRPWEPPHSSVQARWDAERLKARMEHDLLASIFEPMAESRPGVKRYLLAHSPLNYAEWAITFAHADAVRSLPIDGFVGQVWTGTARTPLPVDGERSERTFEHAFLEYSSVHHLTRGTGIETWFLMDPLEDHAGRTMEDYRDNYHRTLAASLLFPAIVRFEVLPWPNRIFGRVPNAFATEIGIVTRVLQDMAHHPGFEADWGVDGIAAFVSDSLMWQRGGPHDRGTEDVLGMAAPLVCHGIPAELAHLDRAAEPGYLLPFDLLLITYEGLKPLGPEVHDGIVQRVRDGAVLVLCLGDDPFRAVDGWWHAEGFEAPEHHLLRAFGLDAPQPGAALLEPAPWAWTGSSDGSLPSWDVPAETVVTDVAGFGDTLATAGDVAVVASAEFEAGHVVVVGLPPRTFLESPGAGDTWRRVIALACGISGQAYRESPWMAAQRGPYLVVGAIREPYQRSGSYVDLLDATLPEVREISVPAGQAGLFLDLERLPSDGRPAIACTSSRVVWRRRAPQMVECVLRGPAGVRGSLRIRLGSATIAGADAVDAWGTAIETTWSREEGRTTGLLRYPEQPLGLGLRLRFEPAAPASP